MISAPDCLNSLSARCLFLLEFRLWTFSDITLAMVLDIDIQKSTYLVYLEECRGIEAGSAPSLGEKPDGCKERRLSQLRGNKKRKRNYKKIKI